ncbi:phosphatase PAP2 family protein [Faecalibacter rhinopitheci]|uniref:Phosphatase PAP2 family protein n=1 Tax=Faecalibacter rhinopitheci TaxID=2779678 RepID=A0A8J7FP92_9FLAO|nr:phosphatase PAP2 family protein [Faecalibacter rhinopitheci]MBF0597360.1 phosphatase PAP2 family protein [Faecalibacter rhinopitheci]MBQ0148864.1 phosphatase PAP2 family protein [Candidatus Onthonaster equi]
MVQDFFNWDIQWFLYFNNLGESKWDSFWLVITQKETWIPLYAFFIIVLYFKFGWKKTLLVAVCIALMITCADQLSNVFKNYFERLRPCHNPDIQGAFRAIDCEGRGKFGFTSAHASNHVAVAIFLGLILYKHYKWLIYVLILWAIMIAYSRVYVGVHFTGDIFFGSIIGIIFGVIFSKLYFFALNKYQDKL